MRNSKKKAKTVQDDPDFAPTSNSSSKRGKRGKPGTSGAAAAAASRRSAAAATAAAAPGHIASWPGSHTYSLDRAPAYVNHDGTIPKKCIPAMKPMTAGYTTPTGRAKAAGRAPAGSPLSPAMNGGLLQWQLMQAQHAAGQQVAPWAAGAQGGVGTNYMQQQASSLSPSLQAGYGSPLLGMGSAHQALAGMPTANMMNNGLLQLQQLHLQMQMQAQRATAGQVEAQGTGVQVGVAGNSVGMQHGTQLVMPQQAAWLSPRIQASSNGILAAPPYGGFPAGYAAEGTFLQVQPPAGYPQAPKFLDAAHELGVPAAPTGEMAGVDPLPALKVPAFAYPVATQHTPGSEAAGLFNNGLTATPASPSSATTTVTLPPELNGQQQLPQHVDSSGALFGKEDSFWDIVGREESFDFSAWEELLSAGDTPPEDTPAEDTPATATPEIVEELQGLLDIFG